MNCVCLEVELDKIAMNLLLGLKIGIFDDLGIRVCNWTQVDAGISYELNIGSRLPCSIAKQLRNAEKSTGKMSEGIRKWWIPGKLPKKYAPLGGTRPAARHYRREVPLCGCEVQFWVLGGLVDRGCGKIKSGIGSLLFRGWRKCEEVCLSGNLSITITKA